MSGHSHYATTHRQKEIKDQARGKVFSKLARAITIAVKTGGGDNPDFNIKLRMAIEKARSVSMPKDNIERAVSKGASSEALDEVKYEGFGPLGISLIIEVATDNRNRTGSEIKNILERAGGKLGGPGSVSFNFDPKGLIVVKKPEDADTAMMSLIDLNVDDVEDAGENFDVYVEPAKLFEKSSEITTRGMTVLSSELVERPKNYVTVSSEQDASRIIKFLSTLEDHDDVQKVFANVDILQELNE